MLRRLTRAQFGNALHDLLGVDVNTSELAPDSWDGDFAVIGASAVITSENGVEQYQAAIEGALSTVFADSAKRAQLLGCTPTGSSTDACLRGFLGTLGRRAWRRPLETVELEQLVSVAALASTTLGSALDGAHWATVALLASPNFLYRPELGADGADGVRRLTDYEVASRLSFLLWNTVPDLALLDAAASGALSTAQGLRAQVDRMLDTQNGRQSIGDFAEQYMRLDRIGTQAKDSLLFPEYDSALQSAMVRDMRGTWEAVAFEEQQSALSLFTTRKVIANAALAKLYGLDSSGLDAKTFKVLSLPEDGPRSGILGKAAFLSQFANQKEGSPTLRGKFLRGALMCAPIPPPPADVSPTFDDLPVDQAMTKRQRLEEHRTKPACAGCHSRMDPLGLPLENFDAIGRFRTTDHGLPIDSSGELDGTNVADARALGVAMSSSVEIANCLVRNYYAYASGHVARPVDESVLNELTVSFQASGFKLKELVVGIVTHPAFSRVAPPL
jgi:uncharacterized protein DUF1592/uncharacterized protein DUF1588/uncharacterized protein DUF1595/uncharacterized protein DUF1587/uncharacterized protein DUF1585